MLPWAVQYLDIIILEAFQVFPMPLTQIQALSRPWKQNYRIQAVVCAPNEDYVTGCLLTRGGSKMLGMHQMVDGINCMLGYCVLIGCLATEGGRQ